MVMLFSSDRARKYLIRHGYVYTFRKNQHKEGKDWVTDKRGNPKLFDVDIKLVMKIDYPLELNIFVSKSGFRTLHEWLKEIRRLNPIPYKELFTIEDCKNCTIKGYLYYAKRIKSE